MASTRGLYLSLQGLTVSTSRMEFQYQAMCFVFAVLLAWASLWYTGRDGSKAGVSQCFSHLSGSDFRVC